MRAIPRQFGTFGCELSGDSDSGLTTPSVRVFATGDAVEAGFDLAPLVVRDSHCSPRKSSRRAEFASIMPCTFATNEAAVIFPCIRHVEKNRA